MTYDDFKIVPFEKKYFDPYFSCGNASIDAFFQTNSIIKSSEDTLFCLIDKTDSVYGLFSIRCSGVNLRNDCGDNFTFPAIELSYFALCECYQGIDVPEIGEHYSTVFLATVLKYLTFIAENICGASYVFLYSVPDIRALNLYKKFGFKELSRSDFSFLPSDYNTDCIPMILAL